MDQDVVPNPGEIPDRPDYRQMPPGQAKPCKVLVLVGGREVRCRGAIEVWQHRSEFHRVGPDGWWGYGY